MAAQDAAVARYVASQLPVEGYRHAEPQKAEPLLNNEQKFAQDTLEISKEAARLSLPVVTITGVAMMCSKGNGMLDGVFKLMGFPIAIGGLVIDTVKAPFTLLGSFGAFLVGSGAWLVSLFTSAGMDKEAPQKQEIMQSFMIRFGNTLKILVTMDDPRPVLGVPGGIREPRKLETLDTIREKCQRHMAGDMAAIASLVSLTLLHSAYASRDVYDGLEGPGILLANEKILYRKDCPKEGIDVFDAVIKIKNILHRLVWGKGNAVLAPIMLEWIPVIKEALEIENRPPIWELYIRTYPENPIPKPELTQEIDQIVELLKHVGDVGVRKPTFQDHTRRLQQEAHYKASQAPRALVQPA